MVFGWMHGGQDLATESLSRGMNCGGKRVHGLWTLLAAPFADLVLVPVTSDSAVVHLESACRTLEIEIEVLPTGRGNHLRHLWGSVCVCACKAFGEKRKASDASAYASVRDFAVVCVDVNVALRFRLLACVCGAMHFGCAAVAVWFLRRLQQC